MKVFMPHLQPIKNHWTGNLLPHWYHMIRWSSWIAEDLLKKLGSGTDKILLWSAIGTLIMGSFYRYLRAAPGFRWIENKNYLLLAPICIFLPYCLLKNKWRKLDGLFLLSAITFNLTFLIAGWLTSFREQLVQIAAYIMPIPAYFLFRYSRISERQIVNSMLCFAMIGCTLVLTEFIATNYLGSKAFYLAFHHYLSDATGFDIDTRVARNIPFMGRALGIFGPGGSPFATAGLFLALSFYGVSLYRHRPAFKRSAMVIALLSFICFYLCGSKTAYMVAIMLFGLFYFGVSPITIGTMFVIGLGSMILYMLSLGGGVAGIGTEFFEGGILKSFVFFGNAFVQTDPKYWFYLLFGQGNESILQHAEFQGEIDILDQFIRVGLFNYAVLVAILILYIQSILTIKNAETRRILLPGLIFLLTLILGGLHYEAIFKYPANLIATAFIGYAMNRISRSRSSESSP